MAAVTDAEGSIPERQGNTALLEGLARRSEAFVIPLAAIVLGLALYSLFILALGKSPIELFQLIYKGGIGTWFSIQNSSCSTSQPAPST